MRLFEAAAAGALIITEDFEFPRYWFRNSVLYVDADLPAPVKAEQIIAHVEWARLNPEAASRLATRSNELFRRRLCLENMLRTLPEFVERIRGCCGMVPVKEPGGNPQPVVEYIVRVGSRPAAAVARALASLAAQTYREIAIVLVAFHPVPELDAVIDQYRTRFRWIRRIVVSNNGCGSTSWWAGLNALTADFFGMLDDGDTLFSNHVASLMDRLKHDSRCGFAYSGLIRQEDEPGHYIDAEQFHGPSGNVIEERREVLCLSEEDFVDFLPTKSTIGRNAWICRASLLDSEALADPKVEFGEDAYFTALMADRTRFEFTAMPTAVWHGKSTVKENRSLSCGCETEEVSLARWQERLQNVKLPMYNRVPAATNRFDLKEAINADLSD
jgi:hypothetical protein